VRVCPVYFLIDAIVIAVKQREIFLFADLFSQSYLMTSFNLLARVYIIHNHMSTYYTRHKKALAVIPVSVLSILVYKYARPSCISSFSSPRTPFLR
jgi:hypothetical protein